MPNFGRSDKVPKSARPTCLAILAACLRRVKLQSGEYMLGGRPYRGIPIATSGPPLSNSVAGGPGETPNAKITTSDTAHMVGPERPQAQPNRDRLSPSRRRRDCCSTLAR